MRPGDDHPRRRSGGERIVERHASPHALKSAGRRVRWKLTELGKMKGCAQRERPRMECSPSMPTRMRCSGASGTDQGGYLMAHGDNAVAGGAVPAALRRRVVVGGGCLMLDCCDCRRAETCSADGVGAGHRACSCSRALERGRRVRRAKRIAKGLLGIAIVTTALNRAARHTGRRKTRLDDLVPDLRIRSVRDRPDEHVPGGAARAAGRGTGRRELVLAGAVEPHLALVATLVLGFIANLLLER